MAGNKYPVYGLTPNHGVARATAANTNRDGTGTTYTVITGGTNGTRVERVFGKSEVTTTAGMARLFHKSGSTFRFLDEVNMTALTPSGTVQSWQGFFNPAIFPIILKNAETLEVSINNAEATIFHAEGTDF